MNIFFILVKNVPSIAATPSVIFMNYKTNFRVRDFLLNMATWEMSTDL